MQPPRNLSVAADRVDTLRGYLRYLHSVAARPETINTEIERRMAAVTLHLTRIEELKALRDNVHDLIQQKQAELKVAKQNVVSKKLEDKAARFRELQQQMARLMADIEREERKLNA